MCKHFKLCMSISYRYTCLVQFIFERSSTNVYRIKLAENPKVTPTYTSSILYGKTRSKAITIEPTNRAGLRLDWSFSDDSTDLRPGEVLSVSWSSSSLSIPG